MPEDGAVYAEFNDAAENLLLAVGGASNRYAECDNAAERLLLAVGGVSMGRVAGAGFEPATFGL